jgi:hypothetical protein
VEVGPVHVKTGPTLKKWISEDKPQLDFGLRSLLLRKSLPTTLLSPDVGYRPHPDTEGTDSKRKTERER